MGNPSPTDRRFDKPSLELLVDLINHSNKTYIKYGEIEVAQIISIEGSESVLWNTQARIRLAGAGAGAPHATMTYGRLDIGEFLPTPQAFSYDGLAPPAALFEQLRAKHRIRLHEDECTLSIGGLESNGTRLISFSPNSDHPVWTGVLTVTVPAPPPPDPEPEPEPEEVNLVFNGYTLTQLQEATA